MSKLYSRARTPPYPPPQAKFDRHSSSKNVELSKDFPSKQFSYREYEKFDKYSDFDKYDDSKYKQDKVSNYKLEKELKDNLYDKYSKPSKADIYDKYDKPLKGDQYKYSKPLKGDQYDKYDKPLKRESSYDKYKPLKGDHYDKYDKPLKDQYDKYDKPLKDDHYSKYDKPLKDDYYDKYEKPSKSSLYDKEDRYIKSLEKIKDEKKFDSYAKYDRAEKSDIYSSAKTYDRDDFQNYSSKKYSDKIKSKGNDSYREVSANYVKVKGPDNYSNQTYRDREPYPSKYGTKNTADYSVYASMDSKAPPGKYQRLGVEDFPDNTKRYDKFPSKSYSKYDSVDQGYSFKDQAHSSISNEWYGDDRMNYKNKNGSGYQGSKGYAQEGGGSSQSFQRGPVGSRTTERYPPKKSPERLDRYVIGDSVVYGSPGHYPEDLYEKSPPPRRKKRISSPPPPPPIQPYSAHAKTSYNRSSSPKRYGNDRLSARGQSLNSYGGNRKSPGRKSLLGKPPSPPPLPLGGFVRGEKSLHQSTGHKKSSRVGYTDFDDDVEMKPTNRKSGSNSRIKRSKDRGQTGENSFANKEKSRRPPLINKPPARSQYANHSGSQRKSDSSYPHRLSPPKPLLSLELPAQFSRLNDVLSPLDSNRVPLGPNRIQPRSNRMEGRIGQANVGLRRGMLLNQDGQRNRRPTDLRAWIEYKKDSKAGQRQKLSPKRVNRALGPRAVKPRDQAKPLLNRARNVDVPRRTLYKGRRIVGTSRGALKRPVRPTALPTKRRARAGSSDSLPRKSKSYKSSKLPRKDASKSSSARKDSSKKDTSSRRRRSRSTSRTKRLGGAKVVRKSKKVGDSTRTKTRTKSSSAVSPSRTSRRMAKEKLLKIRKTSSSKRSHSRKDSKSRSPRGPRSPKTPRSPRTPESRSLTPKRDFKSDRSESPDNEKNTSFTQLDEPSSIPMLDDRRRSSSPEKEY